MLIQRLLDRRELVADTLGLCALLLTLLSYLQLPLLLLPTISAGGDTPCHYPTAVFFQERLAELRFHGWYPGAYLGHPLLLYYFPLPFLVMSALAPLTGMPVAFKLGSLLGVLLLPLLTYAAFRLLALHFPGPLLGATFTTVFLFLEDNPIWGGTLASTLTGEFSYTYGIGLGVLFLGMVFWAHGQGRSPWLPAAALGLVALAHGYAVLWAGLSASCLLYTSRRPWRTLGWLAAVALLAFSFAAFFLLPLLSDWGWTTAYDDPWITVGTQNLLPPLLWPLFGCAALGLLAELLRALRRQPVDQRLVLFGHATLVAMALAASGPALGIIDIRFVPFAQLSACLLGAAAAGIALQRLPARDLVALLLVAMAIVYSDYRSQVLRSWVEWNYTGLEQKELWPAWKQLNEELKGTVADPRVAVEYSAEHEKAGSIRMYETLPLLSGRSTLEGVYNQASLQTHAVYYLTSELCATSPNPFRNRHYSSFDPDRALHHLRLFNTREIVALSPTLIKALEARDNVEHVVDIPPYHVFRLLDSGPGYVEPLAFEPVRSSMEGWREKAYRWFARKPPSPVHLVFTDDSRFALQEVDEWLPPPERALEPGVEVQEVVEAEEIRIRTSRPGHPLLVKVSYHPRWRAEGADGPFLVSPALMMVIPRAEEVRLYYSLNWADRVGWLLSGGALLLAVALGFWRRWRGRGVASGPPGGESFRWGGVVPLVLLLALFGSRQLTDSGATTADRLETLTGRAYQANAAGDFAAAAEYARHALDHKPDVEQRGELHCLRGEALLRAGLGRRAAESFQAILDEPGAGAFRAQALGGLVRAWEAAGEPAAAAPAREQLLREHADTPWAEQARPDDQPASPATID